MALIKNITERFEIPHEPANFMVLRKLTWKQLARAAEIRSEQGATKIRTLGGEVFKVLQDAKDDPEKLAKAEKDALNRYDIGTLLAFGVANWEGPAYRDPVNPENVEALDPKTAEWAARLIVKISESPNAEEAKND